jgi:hypothetical protein
MTIPSANTVSRLAICYRAKLTKWSLMRPHGLPAAVLYPSVWALDASSDGSANRNPRCSYLVAFPTHRNSISADAILPVCCRYGPILLFVEDLDGVERNALRVRALH